MSTPSLPVPGEIEGALDNTPLERPRGTYLDLIHSWVVTVDHKRIGILYIVYALFRRYMPKDYRRMSLLQYSIMVFFLLSMIALPIKITLLLGVGVPVATVGIYLLPADREPRVFAPDELFQFGIEEEYFLCDSETFEAPAETPDALFQAADCCTTGRIGREFLQAQIEVATEPQASLDDARAELLRLRHSAAAAAGEFGLSILACGTHPLAQWRHSVQTPKDRYAQIMDDLQMVGHRDMLCGAHIHVEFAEPARRIEVMTRMLPYVPLFIALSASSPFWQGHMTGLKGYRLAAYDELPRTGLPELFRCEADYDAYVDAMVRSGAMPDASHLWWAIRPSLKYPTLELRDLNPLCGDEIRIQACLDDHGHLAQVGFSQETPRLIGFTKTKQG